MRVLLTVLSIHSDTLPFRRFAFFAVLFLAGLGKR